MSNFFLSLERKDSGNIVGAGGFQFLIRKGTGGVTFNQDEILPVNVGTLLYIHGMGYLLHSRHLGYSGIFKQN